MVNCVIFVVSAVQILQSMDSDDETKRQQTRAVASNFNYPLLSFKGINSLYCNVVITSICLLAF